jgi:MoaA/NifB/PqqE/SkfB family radical SAM enzyme
MKKIFKTVVIAGYACNNRCSFCYNLHKDRGLNRSTAELMREMAIARARGSVYLEIIGGEQTIRPDIVALVGFAKELGFKVIAMATNGRMFSYRSFARRIVRAGLNHVIFSFVGPTARVHDSLTGVRGSFAQALKGLRNVRDMGVGEIGANVTILKPNYRQLPEIGRRLISWGIRNVEFIFVDPTRGGALERFEELVPRISQAAPYIRRCLKVGVDHGAVHWHVRYVPLCHFTGWEDHISEIHERRIFRTEHVAPDFRNSDVYGSRARLGRIKPPKCRPCRYYAACEGIWREYFKRRGDRELRPC